MKKRVVVVALILAGLAVLPVFGQKAEGQWGIGVFGGAKKLVGDKHDWDLLTPMAGAKLEYTPMPVLSFTLSGAYSVTYPYDRSKDGIGKYVTKYPDTPFKTTLLPILLDVKANLRPESRLNPYLTWGIGALVWDLTNDGESVHGQKTNALTDLGLGVEWALSQSLGLDLAAHYGRILRQDLDMAGLDDKQTGLADVRFGLNWFFGGNRDTDGDGVLNKNDKCPKVAEDLDGFQDADGCPDLDNDGDGIPDAKDGAPNQAEDIDGYQDADGVPDLDNDGDGVADVKDGAPNQAEDIDGYQDADGVPDADNDGDGILDAKDKCPNQAETVNGFEDEDGCPDTKPEVIIERAAPIVLEGVTFKTGSAVLTAGAKEVLDKVVRTLTDYPAMKLQVSGHTDNVGSKKTNTALSLRRAESVKAYMASKGIAQDRIETRGFGPDKPVATNDTKDGRALNRRIEFIRID
jgi:outer membrane protein OmpA-like peptidoglycan-associated protein/opacity protein-like surface antigen